MEIDEGDEETGEDAADQPDSAAVGTATLGEELGRLTGGSPQDVLDIWLGGLESVLADAVTPNLADLADQLADGGELDLDAWTGTRRRKPSSSTGRWAICTSSAHWRENETRQGTASRAGRLHGRAG